VSDEPIPDPTCQVCGRRLLPGERATAYVTRDGTGATVCELCKPRAEAAGWMHPDEADAIRAGATGRPRRRPRSQVLGGLLSRLPAATNGEGRGTADSSEEEEVEPESPRRRRPGRDRPPAASRAASTGASRTEPAGDSPGISLPEALAAFNASDHRRTVAGLTRTLGAPRASGLAVRTNGGYPGARLTVAWEITWYQWEVAPGPRGPEVRESGKGETIDQLRAADRTWNLMIDADGSLEKRVASSAEPAEEQ
jgi:hypothetical protein